MANKVADSENLAVQTGINARMVVRDSGGDLYLVVVKDVSGGGETTGVWKSTDGGSTWTEQDAANAPGEWTDGYTVYIAADIDSSGVIHIIEYGASSSSAVFYGTFDTGTDSWTLTDDQTHTGDQDASTDNEGLGIAVDSNDKPHIVFIDADASKGTDYDTVYYQNKIGASWSSEVEVEGMSNTDQCGKPDIAINDSNVPVISYINTTDSAFKKATGNQNDASSFSLTTLDSSANTTAGNYSTSIAVDSGGTVWAAYKDGDGSIAVFEGTTQHDTGTTGDNPTLAMDGTDAYVFYEDSSDNIAYDKWDGSSWAGSTVIELGTYSLPIAKWSRYNNYGSDGTDYGGISGIPEIDYIFSDGTDIWYNNLSISTGGITVEERTRRHIHHR